MLPLFFFSALDAAAYCLMLLILLLITVTPCHAPCRFFATLLSAAFFRFAYVAAITLDDTLRMPMLFFMICCHTALRYYYFFATTLRHIQARAYDAVVFRFFMFFAMLLLRHAVVTPPCHDCYYAMPLRVSAA